MKTFKLLPIDGRKTLSNHHVNMYDCEGETFSDLISYETRVASYNHTTNEKCFFAFLADLRAILIKGIETYQLTKII